MSDLRRHLSLQAMMIKMKMKKVMEDGCYTRGSSEVSIRKVIDAKIRLANVC